MPSPQGQSVGLTQDCRAMPLSSGSSDTYIWKHLLSFKEKYNPEACVFLFLPKLLLWSNPGGLGSPHSAGIWEDWESFLSKPKGIAAHYCTSFQTQHCGFEYPEEKMQHAPPDVVLSELTANLLRQREEQSLWWSSRCPRPGTIVRSSMNGSKEWMPTRASVPCHHPLGQECYKRYHCCWETIPLSITGVAANCRSPHSPCGTLGHRNAVLSLEQSLYRCAPCAFFPLFKNQQEHLKENNFFILCFCK